MQENKLTLVITETHLMADNIAQAIGANDCHDDYYLGNGYAVTWTNGMIVEDELKRSVKFVTSSIMDVRKFYAHNFSFKLRDMDDIVGYGRRAKDERRLQTIRRLWEMSETVVNAMCPDVDGEKIFLNLCNYLNLPGNIRRAWLSELSNKVIVNAIENGIWCERDKANYEEWLRREICNYFIAQCGLEIEQTNLNISVASPDEPPLDNLFILQIRAEREFGFDYGKTAKIAKSLYAKKLVSYPWLLQNCAPRYVERYIRRRLRSLRCNSKWEKLIPKNFSLLTHTFANGWGSPFDGHGIVVTGLQPINLNKDELKVFDLIVKDVVAAFVPVVHGHP